MSCWEGSLAGSLGHAIKGSLPGADWMGCQSPPASRNTNRWNPLFHKRQELKREANWGFKGWYILLSIICILAARSLRRAALLSVTQNLKKCLLGVWFVHLFNMYWLPTTTYLGNKQKMQTEGTHSLFRGISESSSWGKLILPCAREHCLILFLRSLILKKSSKYIPKVTLSNQKIWIGAVKAWKHPANFL